MTGIIHKPGCPSPWMCMCYGKDSIFIAPPIRPKPGEVYSHPNSPVIPYKVVVAVDGDNVLVAPADGFSCYGLSDVAVKDGEYLYIRCGRTVWVDYTTLPKERCFRTLSPHHTQRVVKKLAQIATGPLNGASNQWEDEANPDYEYHMKDVTQFALHLQDEQNPLPLPDTTEDDQSPV